MSFDKLHPGIQADFKYQEATQELSKIQDTLQGVRDTVKSIRSKSIDAAHTAIKELEDQIKGTSTSTILISRVFKRASSEKDSPPLSEQDISAKKATIKELKSIRAQLKSKKAKDPEKTVALAKELSDTITRVLPEGKDSQATQDVKKHERRAELKEFKDRINDLPLLADVKETYSQKFSEIRVIVKKAIDAQIEQVPEEFKKEEKVAKVINKISNLENNLLIPQKETPFATSLNDNSLQKLEEMVKLTNQLKGAAGSVGMEKKRITATLRSLKNALIARKIGLQSDIQKSLETKIKENQKTIDELTLYLVMTREKKTPMLAKINIQKEWSDHLEKNITDLKNMKDKLQSNFTIQDLLIQLRMIKFNASGERALKEGELEEITKQSNSDPLKDQLHRLTNRLSEDISDAKALGQIYENLINQIEAKQILPLEAVQMIDAEINKYQNQLNEINQRMQNPKKAYVAAKKLERNLEKAKEKFKTWVERSPEEIKSHEELLKEMAQDRKLFDKVGLNSKPFEAK